LLLPDNLLRSTKHGVPQSGSLNHIRKIPEKAGLAMRQIVALYALLHKPINIIHDYSANFFI
jgi:hypothetical protein